MSGPRLIDDVIERPGGLFRRASRLHLDDVERVEGTCVVGRHGDRVELPVALAEAVSRAVAGPDLSGDPIADRAGIKAFSEAPHGPRRLARALVEWAERCGATDLHLASDGSSWTVRARLEGELEELVVLSDAAGTRLVAALKGWSGCLPYRSDVVQEGRIGRTGTAADIRASFIPTPFGNRVALRLFGRLRSLDELGFSPDLLASLRRVLAQPSGLLLVAGSTGAGKTTTLYAALAHLAAARTGAHLSLEDPVEQRLRAAGVPVDQVELDPARGHTGESMLAAALRQDVDVIAVGEVRTPAEALLALRAAQTGRLVLAGIHAGSVDEAKRRMLDLGAEASVLGGSLRAVLHQSMQVVPDASVAAGRRRRVVATLRVFEADRGLEVVA